MKSSEKIMRQVLTEFGFSKEEADRKISDAKIEEKELKGWIPVCVGELGLLSNLNQIKSICWRDGKYRCTTVGISELSVVKDPHKEIVIRWSDGNGDPHLHGNWLSNTKIHKLTSDGEWAYGLYKKLRK